MCSRTGSVCSDLLPHRYRVWSLTPDSSVWSFHVLLQFVGVFSVFSSFPLLVKNLLSLEACWAETPPSNQEEGEGSDNNFIYLFCVKISGFADRSSAGWNSSELLIQKRVFMCCRWKKVFVFRSFHHLHHHHLRHHIGCVKEWDFGEFKCHQMHSKHPITIKGFNLQLKG